MSNRSLRTVTVAAIALFGISCSSSTSSQGTDLGNGGAFSGPFGGGFQTAMGGIPGSGGVVSNGAGGNGAGIAGSGAGGSILGVGGNGGPAGGGAENGGTDSGGSANGGSSSGGTAGIGGTGGTTPRTDGGTPVGSTGCGKTPTITFGMVPGEDANA